MTGPASRLPLIYDRLSGRFDSRCEGPLSETEARPQVPKVAVVVVRHQWERDWENSLTGESAIVGYDELLDGSSRSASLPPFEDGALREGRFKSTAAGCGLQRADVHPKLGGEPTQG